MLVRNPPDDAPTTRIDFAGAALAADPWPALRDLREQGPLVWHETSGRWLVTTDRAVRKVLADFSRFTVEDTFVAELFGADAFISIDDRARHDALRDIWVDAFRTHGLEKLRPVVRRIVDGLVAEAAARLADGETVDVAEAVCRPLPTVVISLMMGVPEAAIPDIVRWSDAMASGNGTWLPEAEALRRRLAQEEARRQLAAYLGELLAARRTDPTDDLVSRLAVSAPGRRLPDAQLVQNLRQLLFAGNETTAKWLGHILVTLAERPALRAELAADRALVPAADDEVMRWQTVVGTTPRRVRGGATALMGIALEDGAELSCLLGCANRDPARYEDPDRFDIHRSPQPHLGFGIGLHNCLGSMLAKLEAEETVGAVLDAMPGFALAEPPAYSPAALRGPLAVRLVRAA